MKNRVIAYLLLFVIVVAAVGSYALTRHYFPRIIETETKVKPTEHELQELARQIAEPEIQKAKTYWENKPPVIIEIPGKDSTRTITLHPKATVDIRKVFSWSFTFPNKDRAADTLIFNAIDSLSISTYEDSTGSSFIGHKLIQTIDSLRLVINPQIIEREVITKFALFGGLGFGIESEEKIIDNQITKQNYLNYSAEIMGEFEENWYGKIMLSGNSQSQTVWLLGGKKIFGKEGKK
jgi:hypothetical protein